MPGETPEQAAIRELWEEVGLRANLASPCVWERTHVFTFQGLTYEAQESYFVSRVDSHEPLDDHVNPDELERSWTLGHRWWSLEEIVAATHEVFVPRALGELLPALLRGDYPAAPLTVGT
jgi:8-oxo-dGTP pyrophosphatase MutT (NUDIX family)